MASVYKRTRRKPIPEDAEVVERRGKRYAVWESRRRRRRALLADDGQTVLIEEENYTVSWFDWQGKRRKTSGGPDKDAAEALGRKLEAEEMQRRRGLIDPAAERFAAEGRRPIGEHLADFRKHLESKGDTQEHVDLVSSRLQSVVKRSRFDRLSDLTASTVQATVASLRDEKSLRTCNGYLRAVRSFSRWAWQDGRLTSDPLASLRSYNEQTDRRRRRRAVSANEFARLVQAAEGGPSVESIPGPDRALLYILSAWTGFRRRELASLTTQSFALNTDPPTVTVQAAHSKRRRTDTQVLHPFVVERVLGWLASKPDNGPDCLLFPLRTRSGSWRKTAKMMRKDLHAARAKWIAEATSDTERARRRASDFLAYQDKDGLFADFHAHRHTFISNLGRAGVPLSIAQKLARHCDPKLTANVYTHLEIADQVVAIESLPSLPEASPRIEQGQQSFRATGTDNTEMVRTWAERKGQHLGQQSDGEARRSVATGGERQLEPAPEPDGPQVLTLSREKKNRQVVATAGKSGDERARTANPRLAKPVLSQLSYVPGSASGHPRGGPGASHRGVDIGPYRTPPPMIPSGMIAGLPGRVKIWPDITTVRRDHPRSPRGTHASC
jgi:integrase